MHEQPQARPRYVVVGHMTMDVAPDRSTAVLGGTVAYSGAQAAARGARVEILTRGNPRDLDPLWAPYRHVAALTLQESAWTTVFVNTEHPTGRIQHLESWAGEMEVNGSLTAEIVHFAPVARELDMAKLAPTSVADLVCLTAQGLIRHWGPDKRIYHRHLTATAAWRDHIDVVVVSMSEARYLEDLVSRAFLRGDRMVVVTNGDRGCSVVSRFAEDHFPAASPSGPVVDTTGAGDVFAAMFALMIHQGRSLAESVRTAAAEAAYSTEGSGIGHVLARSSRTL